MQKILKHYYDSWWKVAGQPIYYLAGNALDNLELAAGKWYFNDEAQILSIAYDTYAEAAIAQKLYAESL